MTFADRTWRTTLTEDFERFVPITVVITSRTPHGSPNNDPAWPRPPPRNPGALICRVVDLAPDQRALPSAWEGTPNHEGPRPPLEPA